MGTEGFTLIQGMVEGRWLLLGSLGACEDLFQFFFCVCGGYRVGGGGSHCSQTYLQFLLHSSLKKKISKTENESPCLLGLLHTKVNGRKVLHILQEDRGMAGWTGRSERIRLFFFFHNVFLGMGCACNAKIIIEIIFHL